MGELQGKLAAAEAVSVELANCKKEVHELRGKMAADETRLHELFENQRLSQQQAAVAMSHAQQHANSEYERLQAEHQAAHQTTAAQGAWWRQRAERRQQRGLAAAATVAATRSNLESLLSRLVSATSVADMADQSRLLFEVKAALLEVEDGLRRPDSAGGGPPQPADGKSGRGHGRKGAPSLSSQPFQRGGGGGGGAGGGAPPPPPPPGAGATAPPFASGGMAGGGGLYGGCGAPPVSSSAPALHLPGIGAPFATAMGVGAFPPSMYGGLPAGLPFGGFSGLSAAGLGSAVGAAPGGRLGGGGGGGGYTLSMDPASLGASANPSAAPNGGAAALTGGGGPPQKSRLRPPGATRGAAAPPPAPERAAKPAAARGGGPASRARGGTNARGGSQAAGGVPGDRPSSTKAVQRGVTFQ